MFSASARRTLRKLSAAAISKLLDADRLYQGDEQPRKIWTKGRRARLAVVSAPSRRATARADHIATPLRCRSRSRASAADPSRHAVRSVDISDHASRNDGLERL